MIREGAGAAIISEEAFVGESMRELLQVLQQQPSWSDFPLILLTVSGRVTVESERLREMRRPLGNLFLLERPIRPETLLSTLEIALARQGKAVSDSRPDSAVCASAGGFAAIRKVGGYRPAGREHRARDQ